MMVIARPSTDGSPPNLRKPCSVADYRDRAGLDRLEPTPVDRPQSHRVEVVGLHHLGGHDAGLASDTYADRSRYGRCGDVFEHVAGRVPNIEKVRVGIPQRQSARVAREHGDQTTRVRAGERTQKQSIDQRENGDVRTDADGQDGDRHDRQNRAREQPAESVPQVPPQILGDTEALYVAAFFLDRPPRLPDGRAPCGAPPAAPCRGGCSPRRPAPGTPAAPRRARARCARDGTDSPGERRNLVSGS